MRIVRSRCRQVQYKIHPSLLDSLQIGPRERKRGKGEMMCPLTAEYERDKRSPMAVYFIKFYVSWVFCLHTGAFRSWKRMSESPEQELNRQLAISQCGRLELNYTWSFAKEYFSAAERSPECHLVLIANPIESIILWERSLSKELSSSACEWFS